LDKAEGDHAPAEQRVTESARRPVHDPGLLVLCLEHDRARGIDDELQESDVHREQDERQRLAAQVRHHDREQRHDRDRHVHRENVRIAFLRLS
jgi:hypothetical protein